jgi:hypothetical protein
MTETTAALGILYLLVGAFGLVAVGIVVWLGRVDALNALGLAEPDAHADADASDRQASG